MSERQELSPVTFQDIIMYFTLDEWQLLIMEQKAMYWEIMQQSYHSLLLFGGCQIFSDAFLYVENNKGLSICTLSRLVEHPPLPQIPSREVQHQVDIELFPELLAPLEITCNKEDTYFTEDEERPGPSGVSATEQGGVPVSGGKPQREPAKRASYQLTLEDFLRPCYVRIERLQIRVPQDDSATGAKCPVKEVQEASADNKHAGLRSQAVALDGPTEQRKLYFCAWCKEPFILHVNLEEHHRYCRQKPPLEAKKSPGGQEESGSSSNGDSAGSALLRKKCPPLPSFSEVKKHFLRPRPLVKSKAISYASGDTPKSQCSLAVRAVKKKFQCLTCRKTFVYKRQLMAHLKK